MSVFFARISSVFCCKRISHLISMDVNASIKYVYPITFAKKTTDSAQSSNKRSRKASKVIPQSTKLLVQSATVVFALGFLDAGYSGDWSRIGVISRQTEDYLKASAILVVTLCILLILLLSKKDDDEQA